MLQREAAIRAARCAVAIPCAFFVAEQLLGGGQVSVFASFGGFALLVFADFPGGRSARAASYVCLGVAGAALISLGSVCADPGWLAVAAMLAVGTGVLFVGVLSAALAAASRAALLTFILPVTIPGGVDAIPDRLVGWAIAFGICVPMVLFVFPPADRERFRSAAAALQTTLAVLLRSRLHLASDGADDQQLAADVDERLQTLRAEFGRDVNRPIGLNAGSRAFVRVVDELEWLTPLVTHADRVDMDRWPDAVRAAVMASASVLDASSAVCTAGDREPARLDARRDLDGALAASALRRREAFDATVAAVTHGGMPTPTFRPHEIATTSELVGHSVGWAAMADARPLRQRLTGSGLPESGSGGRLLGEVPPLRTSVRGYLTGRSVWFRNSVRGGIGLALAVLVAVSFDVHHGFWVVLGALSVLRSSALNTGSTALRAVVGTLGGFAIGGLVIVVVGTDRFVLWALFPIAVFIASYAPATMSFAAGQGAFTLVVLILFNLIEPVGWKIGVTRVEDVALGCGISLVVGLLLWPAGAASAVQSALATARTAGAEYFRHAVEVVTRAGAVPVEPQSAAIAAGRVLDDALRQFQVEVGQNRSGLAEITRAAGSVTRLRLAADAICSLGPEVGSTTTLLPRTRFVLDEDAARTAGAQADEPVTGDPAASPEIGTLVASAMRAEIGSGLDPDRLGDLPKRILWATMYVNDVDRRMWPQYARADERRRHE